MTDNVSVLEAHESREEFFPLAAALAALENHDGDDAAEGKKPHQGIFFEKRALHRGIEWSNSTTALGLRGVGRKKRGGSRCTGKERDTESQLDYFGARYHASSLGRWMTPDWAARPTTVPYAVFGDPQSLNLYGYVRNDPVSRADLDGHQQHCFLGICVGSPDPPPPPPPPPVTSHAFETVRINNLTVRQVANVVANENHDVTPGPAGSAKLQEAKTAQANAVMNADKKFGDKREQLAQTAPTTVSPKLANSPQYDQALQAASTALQQQNTGTDPTGGRTSFNNRFNDDMGPRSIGGSEQDVYQRYGPFEYGGGPVYTVIYDDPKK